MVEANLGLVIDIKNIQMRFTILDLIQGGNIGLMKAVDNLNIEGDINFQPMPLVDEQAITRSIADQARTIRPSSYD